LRAEIESWTSGLDKHEIARRLQAHGISAAPICSGEDLYQDPQLAATGFFIELNHPEAGNHRYHGLPFQFANTPQRRLQPAPLLGQHTDTLLREWAGLDDEARQQLYLAGVAVQADMSPALA